jgi:hypothetical protein
MLGADANSSTAPSQCLKSMYVCDALIFTPIPPLFVEISTQAIVTAARVHFLGNPGPDPHGLNEHQALSIHMSDIPCCAPAIQSNHWSQCHPKLPLFLDFRPVIESSRRRKAQSLQAVSDPLSLSRNSSTTSDIHSVACPVLQIYVLTVAQFHQAALRRATQAAPGIANFISSIQASSQLRQGPKRLVVVRGLHVFS